MDDLIIQGLRKATHFPHEIGTIEVIETHISWVILTGLYAYKIKKPVHYDFVDYSTLEMRKHYCELELALNQTLAPSLYISVVPINGDVNHPHIEGTGPIIEYAIKMHQFDQNCLLSVVDKQEGFSKALIQSLAESIALFHKQAQTVPAQSLFGEPESIFQPMLDNFESLKTMRSSAHLKDQIDAIAEWTAHQYQALKPLLQKRKKQGFIRACHGDLHLGNIVLNQGVPIVFDCIEFNESLRHLDVVSDMAFLAMDLDHLEYDRLSHYFENQYFEITQDYEGIQLLAFYKTYRAMIRAKISAIQLETEPSEFYHAELLKYLKLASSYQTSPKPTLTITFGPSGSGKSYHTEKLMYDLKRFRLRSDVIRKYLFSLDTNGDSIYSPALTQKVYLTMRDIASCLLKAGIGVIIDATFLTQAQRALFLELSHELNVPLTLLSFDVPRDLLMQRIQLRQGDVSDATLEVLEEQLKTMEPLNKIEIAHMEKIF